MKKRKFLVPRQAADAAKSNGKSPAAGQAAGAPLPEAPLPETISKRLKSKPALQLVRPGTITAEPTRSLIKKPSSVTDRTDAKGATPKTAVSKAQGLSLLLPPAPLPVAAADATAIIPAFRAQRKAFRIPTLPPDALPSLSALLLFENLSISSMLACTLQKAPVPEAGSRVPDLASYDSEALSQTAAEILDGILPSYYEVQQECERNALQGVIFGVSSDKTLRTYSQMLVDSVPFFGGKQTPHSVPAPSPAAALPKKKSTPREKEHAAAAENQTTITQVPTYSDSQGVSIISSAVYVPTPERCEGKEKNVSSEAMLVRSLAEDNIIPFSFLKSLLFP